MILGQCTTNVYLVAAHAFHSDLYGACGTVTRGAALHLAQVAACSDPLALASTEDIRRCLRAFHLDDVATNRAQLVHQHDTRNARLAGMALPTATMQSLAHNGVTYFRAHNLFVLLVGNVTGARAGMATFQAHIAGLGAATLWHLLEILSRGHGELCFAMILAIDLHCIADGMILLQCTHDVLPQFAFLLQTLEIANAIEALFGSRQCDIHAIGHFQKANVSLDVAAHQCQNNDVTLLAL